MSELILKGTDLFMKKTGSADKLHICGNAERMLFLIIGILLVFAGAKVYRLIVSFIMFWGVTIALCTVMDGKTGWGTIVTAFTILGCLMGYIAFKWKTADSMILSAMTAAAVIHSGGLQLFSLQELQLQRLFFLWREQSFLLLQWECVFFMKRESDTWFCWQYADSCSR